MDKDNDLENSPQEEMSIGALLRTAREKKGISKRRLAEEIKVREQIIDALENEEWDKLPARVFIKGFIRSYTISVGYDTKKALRLFDKCSPAVSEDSPKTLTRKAKRSSGIYYVILLLLIIAAAIYVFKVRDRGENRVEEDPSVSDTLPSPADEAGHRENLSEQEKSAETLIPDEEKKTPPLQEAPLKETRSQETTAPETQKQEITQEKPSQASVEKHEEAVEKNNASEKETPAQNTARQEEGPSAETVNSEQPGPEQVLTATVNMRTYVKIIVDDNPPKEYIFQPGSSPQWTARRGFEVTVGNAAGIVFTYNGETTRNIGAMGKVKTLRFPDDFKTEWKE